MPPRSTALAALLLASGGCVGLSDYGPFSHSVSPDEANSQYTTVNRTEFGTHVLDRRATRVKPDQLTPGQHVQIVAAVADPREAIDSASLDLTQYFGVIESVDNDQIVLKEVSIFVESKVVRETPVLSKVPYISRMFKNSAAAQELRPVTGKVAVPRSKIMMAELSSKNFHEFLPVRERIAVDFE